MQINHIIAAFLLLSLTAVSAMAQEEATPPNPEKDQAAKEQADAMPASDVYWLPILNLGGKVGTDRNIGEIELMVPLTQLENEMWFFDFRGRIDDDDSSEFNVGFGLRTALDENFVLGAYGFFDFLESSNDNNFTQATIGVELMTGP